MKRRSFISAAIGVLCAPLAVMASRPRFADPYLGLRGGKPWPTHPDCFMSFSDGTQIKRFQVYGLMQGRRANLEIERLTMRVHGNRRQSMLVESLPWIPDWLTALQDRFGPVVSIQAEKLQTGSWLVTVKTEPRGRTQMRGVNQ